MILNYKFTNFMSFRENVEFSMMAPKTKVKKRFPNNYTTTESGKEVLKTAVVVGENAGGKSNFVRSLDYLQSFFRDNESARVYKNTINTNNLTDVCPKNSNTLQIFEIEIVIDNIGIYLYHLEIDFVGIVKETLSLKKDAMSKYKLIFRANRENKILSCDNVGEKCINKAECGAKIEVEYNLNIPGFNPEMENSLINATKSQKHIGLFITKLAILGNDHAINFTEWLKNSLCPDTNIINYDIYKSIKNEDDDFRILNDSRYLDIFRMIDYSIINFVLDEEKPYSKTLIIRKKNDGSSFSREVGKDSSGVREFFAWAVQIFKVVYEDKVVFADEMDRVLNPVLSDRIISFISGKKHFGQFIFTTHNILHLDLKNYMKEQIYFITKDIETLESEMYSLADFPEIRYETTKIYEFYMKGILGGTAIE